MPEHTVTLSAGPRIEGNAIRFTDAGREADYARARRIVERINAAAMTLALGCIVLALILGAVIAGAKL